MTKRLRRLGLATAAFAIVAGPFATLPAAAATPPSAPSNVTATIGEKQATVSWTVPTSDGGSSITGYVVTPFVGATAGTPVTFNSTATTETVTGLSDCKAYTFTVAAINAVGTGPASMPSAAVTVGAPVLRSVTVGQGVGSNPTAALGFNPLVRGKDTLVRFYLSLPSCASSSTQIRLTGGSLAVAVSGGATLGTVSAPIPPPASPFPQIATFSVAPLVDSPGDPKFLVPGSVLAPASTTAAYMATFSGTITYQWLTSKTATPIPGSVTLSALPGTTTPIASNVERRTNALRILVVPMGDASQSVSSQFSSKAQSTVQDGMLTLSRIYPVENGTSDLSATTGGIRYTINPALLDLGPRGLNLMPSLSTTTTTSQINSGATITSLAVSALSAAIPGGALVIISSASSSQALTVASAGAAASVIPTSIPIATSPTANATYAAGSTVTYRAFCGTSANFDTVKGQLATFLQAWNTANPSATADRVLGAIDQSISLGSSNACAEGMAAINSTQAWVRSIYTVSPTFTGGVMAMEIAHTMGVVPPSRYDIYNPYHSPNITADGTSPNRAYNITQRSYLANSRTAMDFSDGFYNNVNTVLEPADYGFILCVLGGTQNTECGAASGTVGTSAGVGANPTFVMSGTTDGTMTGTNVVESYFAAGVARTTPDSSSVYRLLMKQSGAVLQDFGVPVTFTQDAHDGSPSPETPPPAINTTSGLFSIAFPFNTATDTIEFWKGEPGTTGVTLLYSRTKISPAPQITSTSVTACTPNITVFPTPTIGSTPTKITTGPDGNLWFAEAQADSIGRSTPAGVITEFPVPKWLATGSMSAGRLFASSILLTGGPNAGRVLIAGGYASGAPSLTALASAELYDPTIGTWSATGSMTVSRAEFTLTRLTSGPNAGKILAAGGQTSGSSGNAFTSTAELYDPVAGTWSLTASMMTARMEHTATVMGDGTGRVLVAGGWNGGPLASAELYDPTPTTGNWSSTGSLAAARTQHIAALLSTGRVLVAGGDGVVNSTTTPLASAELFDPSTGIWSPTGSMSTSRLLFGAATLANGEILVAGGKTIGTILNTAELYDPGTGMWSPTGSMTVARGEHTVTLLNDGTVLASGGSNDPRSEVYDPGTGMWRVTGSMTTGRFEHTATLLGSGSVLVAGGLNSSVLASAEVYAPSLMTNGITAGPDGNLWFTEAGAGRIGNITTNGSITQFQLSNSFAGPGPGITTGSDNNLWFVEAQANKIGKITTAGVVTEYPIVTSFEISSTPNDIVSGPDGNLWFTEDNVGKIGKITMAGVITEYAVPSGASSFPAFISAGPDSNLWFTEQNANKIGKITTAGAVTEFSLPASESQPAGITAGPDGNLWFAERASSKIGTITTAGAITEFASAGTLAAPVGITTGPDGNIWFTEFNSAIGRLIPCSQVVTATVTSTVSPSLGRMDCYFVDAAGRQFPFAVGIQPDPELATATFRCRFDPSLAPAGTMLKFVVNDGFSQSLPASATVTSSAKPPVATINSPVPGTHFLQFDSIPLHGAAKDPQDGELGGSALVWSTTIPGATPGSGGTIDLSPPDGGWTPGKYTVTLTATDSAGNTATASSTITIDVDADHDGLSAAVEALSCFPANGGSDDPNGPDPQDAFRNYAGDGIPNIDKVALHPSDDPCVAETSYRATSLMFAPQTLFITSNGNTVTISDILVRYRDLHQVDPSTVRIVSVAGKPVMFTNIGWTVDSDGFAAAKFDRQALITYLTSLNSSNFSIMNHTVTITITGQATNAMPVWSFQGVTSTFVTSGS